MNDMKPLWIVFPKIPWGSVGWRMGPGEDYWHSWMSWFKGLTQAERETYKSQWAEPEAWADFYSLIETGALPGWVLEQQQKVAASAVPPRPEETVIHGYHRVLWLMRHHFKRVRIDRTTEYESIAEIYEAPDGAFWRLSAHAIRGDMHFTRLPRGDA